MDKIIRMENKLKTLKDIEIIGPDGVEDSEYVKGLLRSEAVKWVKDCTCKKAKIKIQDNDEPIREEIHRDYCFSCLRFICFFNLDEEDLKDEK